MKFARALSLVLVGILLYMMVGVVMAEEITPYYLYIKKATCSLSINDNGNSTCRGYINVMDASDISLTLTLYRQSGNAWIYVTSWTESFASVKIANISKMYQATEGTYKLMMNGKVTTVEGDTEYISQSTAAEVYSK